MTTNYRQVFARKSERENRIKAICPDIPNRPGIYAFYRTCESGIRRSYVGQAISLCERCASHLGEYDHIALSLKKHKFYSEENPYGWKLMFKECPKEELDQREVETIKQFADAGFQMYNVLSGSQSAGKTKIGEFKQPKTYTQGKVEGKKQLARDLSNIIDKHLEVKLKPEKQNNKVSQKQEQKFWELLDERNYE